VIVHAATTRSNRRAAAPADFLDCNWRMFFNLVRNQRRFGKMIHFGSGAEYDRFQLPARVREDYFDTRGPETRAGSRSTFVPSTSSTPTESLTCACSGLRRYEDDRVCFISNACCRALKGLPILLL